MITLYIQQRICCQQSLRPVTDPLAALGMTNVEALQKINALPWGDSPKALPFENGPKALPFENSPKALPFENGLPYCSTNLPLLSSRAQREDL